MNYEDLTQPERNLYNSLNSFYINQPSIRPSSWMRVLKTLIEVHGRAMGWMKK